MIITIHVLYLFGKFVYQNYRTTKQKAINNDPINTGIPFKISERDYRMRDPEVPQNFEENPIKFFPPAYIQRYVAVVDILNDKKYQGKLRKIVDFGCAELDFLTYLKNTAGIEEILCVDIDRWLLEAHKNKGAPLISEYLHRSTPLIVEICEGSVTQNDRRLEKTDAVICIELIEHLYPDTLMDLPYNIFGCIKPKVVVITTPNADFNVLFPNFSGFRHHDHKFEWTRRQFQDWAENIILRYPDYIVTFDGICKGPEGTEDLGCCTQMAVFNRISEQQVFNIGQQDLFKTVARYEYPFRTDNRSDEEKILDAATYYIRHLSYQDSDMEEEVPLEKLLNMLKSFHISINTLQTILEEAGWTIEYREFGPVVLVPPISTFSDFSVENYVPWEDYYSATDEDEWNREPGPPISSSGILEQDSLDIWDNQNWSELNTVNTLNNYILEDIACLFNEETINNIVHSKINNEENFDPVPNTSDLNNLFHTDASLNLNESAELSDSSFTRQLENMEEHSFLYATCDTQDDVMSNKAQKLNPVLELPAYMSISRASTSPEPYLLHSVKLDQHFRNDSMCNQSMSNHWMLNSLLEEQDKSMHINVNDSECKKSSLNNDFDNSDHLNKIYLNTSYKQEEDSDTEYLSSNISANVSCFSQDQIQNIQQDTNVTKNNSQLQDQMQLNSISFQFTSSPKIETKVNSIGKKRRSLNYKEQKNNNSSNITAKSQLTSSSSNNLLGDNSETTLQSNNDINVSATIDSGTVKNWHNQDISTYQNDDAVTAAALNVDKQITEETSSLSNNSNMKKNELLQVNLGAINKSKESNSCIIVKPATKQEKIAVINANDIQSVNCDTKVQVTNRQLTIKSEFHAEFYDDNKKTELNSELHDTRDLKSVKNVNNIEMSCDQAKDISNFKNISLLSNIRVEDTRNNQSTSVLKSEKQSECNIENHESKCKNINPNIAEIIETIELKSTSPDTVDTPPNSWSPEVMDSGYPNSASAQDMTPEYDLSSIAQDRISDSESPSIAEAPMLGILEAIEVENGDLANNNRDGEGNNMMAAELNDLEDLQPLIDVLENDIENENDIYALENGFPIWLLRILNMANPNDVEIRMWDHRELGFPNRVAGDDARYVNMERDEGFDSSSEDNSDLENNELRDGINDANENAVMDNLQNDNENVSNSDSGSELWVVGDT